MDLPLVYFYNCRHDNSFEAFNYNKRILLVGLRGAYIDSNLLKCLDDNYLSLREQYEDIYAITVNDGYTVNNWANDINIKNVTVLPDGNAEFTRALGKLSNVPCIGDRSEYYACIAQNHRLGGFYEDFNLFKDKLYTL